MLSEYSHLICSSNCQSKIDQSKVRKNDRLFLEGRELLLGIGGLLLGIDESL